VKERNDTARLNAETVARQQRKAAGEKGRHGCCYRNAVSASNAVEEKRVSERKGEAQV